MRSRPGSQSATFEITCPDPGAGHARPAVPLFGAAASVLTVCLGASVAFAQEEMTDFTLIEPDTMSVESGAASANYVLDPVTVEARRREERLVDVPVSATVIGGEELRKERAREVKDVIRYVPGWDIPSWGENPQASYPIVRGIGSVAVGLSPSNSSAPVFVDGVPLPVFSAINQTLDVGSITALRGPQGTLFGRNSTAGALLVNSAVPDGELFGQITGEFGTHGLWMTEGIAGTPLGDKAALRAAVRYREGGNYISNKRPGQENAGKSEIGAARITLRATPSDALTIQFGASLERDERNGANAAQLYGGDIYTSTPEFSRDMIHTTLNVSYDFEQFTLKSNTGITYWDQRAHTGTDGFAQMALAGAFPGYYPDSIDAYDDEFALYKRAERQLYQELQLQSPQGSHISWVLGGVFMKSDYNTSMTNNTPLSGAASHGHSDEKLDTLSYGFFGDVTYPFWDRFELGAGLRYTHETMKIDAKFRDGLMVQQLDQVSRRHFDMLTGRLSLGYKPTDDSLVYASFSRGAKAGGFPQWTFGAPMGFAEEGYDQTGVWAYEAGVKGSFLDGKLNLALAGFFNDVRSDAVTGMEPTTYSIVTTSVDMETYGFELEGNAELGYGLSMFGALTYTESEITKVARTAQTMAKVGSQAPNVPNWTGSLVLEYRQPLNVIGIPGETDFTGRVGYRYQGESWAEMNNDVRLEAHHAVDVRIGIDTDDFEVYLFGNNLIGEKQHLAGYYLAPGIYSRQHGRGRTFGIGGTVRF